MSEQSPGPPRHVPSDRSSGSPTNWKTALGDAGPYLGLGLQIALTMAFYVGAGVGLDYLLGTLPWLTMTGALLGLGTVLYYVTRVASELGKRSAQRDDEDDSKEA